MEPLSPLEPDNTELTSPKFFKRVDEWLITFNFGTFWKTYFVFRVAVFLDVVVVLLYNLAVPQSDNLIHRITSYLIGVVFLFFYFWVLSQWKFTRLLLSLHVGLMTIAILLYAIILITKL